MMRRKLITSDEATASKGQHKRPCSDCPWARESLPGWLGGSTPELWLRAVHSDTHINCHAQTGPAQCAGSAIYRANVGKLPRDPSILRLKPDREAVFATPMEFQAHHKDVAAIRERGKMIAK